MHCYIYETGSISSALHCPCYCFFKHLSKIRELEKEKQDESWAKLPRQVRDEVCYKFSLELQYMHQAIKLVE